MDYTKEPVRLRRRMLPTGRESLYLDIYYNGKRSYEYLKLYIVPERTRADREKNMQTMRLAEAVRAKRLVDFQNGRFGFTKAYDEDMPLLEYYEQCMNRWEKKDGKGNYACWHSAYVRLKEYIGGRNVTFRDVTPEWIEGFKDFLDNDAYCLARIGKDGTLSEREPLTEHSKANYFSKLRACINRAYEKHLIPDNPMRGISGYRTEDSERPYLTLEEVRALAATPCDYPEIKRAFLFSCLTGLRKSDIEALTWGEVTAQGEFTRIVFRQKKTGGLEYLDISPEAERYLGERGEPDDRVFSGFHYTTATNPHIRLWARDAGIRKRLTFHSGCHTSHTSTNSLITNYVSAQFKIT